MTELEALRRVAEAAQILAGSCGVIRGKTPEDDDIWTVEIDHVRELNAALDALPAPAGKLDALEGEVVDEVEPTPLETLVRKIEATATNAEVDALLRGAKADITAMSDEERAQLETAVTAQRHGFSLGAPK